MSHLELLREEYGSIRYRITRDDGQVDEKKVSAAQVREEARRTHKSLKSILEKLEGLPEGQPDTLVDLADENTPEAASLPQIQRHTHIEFSLPVLDHQHPHEHNHEHSLLPHDHKHEHELIKHEHDHDHKHEHDLPAHGHVAIDIRLAALEKASEVLQGHGHPHEHPHDHNNILQDVFERLAHLADAVLAFETRLAELKTDAAPAQHEHTLVEHYHRIGPHEHPEFGVTKAKSRKAEAQTVHEHSFDTMKGDGIWRCGICGIPRPAELTELPPTGPSEVS